MPEPDKEVQTRQPGRSGQVIIGLLLPIIAGLLANILAAIVLILLNLYGPPPPKPPCAITYPGNLLTFENTCKEEVSIWSIKGSGCSDYGLQGESTLVKQPDLEILGPVNPRGGKVKIYLHKDSLERKEISEVFVRYEDKDEQVLETNRITLTWEEPEPLRGALEEEDLQSKSYTVSIENPSNRKYKIEKMKSFDGEKWCDKKMNDVIEPKKKIQIDVDKKIKIAIFYPTSSAGSSDSIIFNLKWKPQKTVLIFLASAEIYEGSSLIVQIGKTVGVVPADFETTVTSPLFSIAKSYVDNCYYCRYKATAPGSAWSTSLCLCRDVEIQ